MSNEGAVELLRAIHRMTENITTVATSHNEMVVIIKSIARLTDIDKKPQTKNNQQ